MKMEAAYEQRRREIEEYFDRTAWKTWASLTSDQPVGRIRATVRAGRERMRGTLLGYLPADLEGVRILDAGCGTGALAIEAVRRGAHVVAIDISPNLVEVARKRAEGELGPTDRLELRVGDMADPELGDFDWVIAMDSIIHYPLDQLVTLVGRLAERAQRGLTFTFAPSTPLLALMHFCGRAFPKGNRSPDLQPIGERRLRAALADCAPLADFTAYRSDRIESGFYTSQTMELRRG